MINRAPIITLAATGNHMEKTKYGPFHKDLAIDVNFYGIFCIVSLGGLQFGCMLNRLTRSIAGNMRSFSSITYF